MDKPGTYTFGFLLDGPQGHGEGSLQEFQVLEQPGPPLSLSWTVASLPLVGTIAVAWRQVRSGRRLRFSLEA